MFSGTLNIYRGKRNRITRRQRGVLLFIYVDVVDMDME